LIEPDHLATIYQAMLSAVSAKGSTKVEADDMEQTKELVQGLRGMKRWKMVQGLLSKKEKEVMRDLSARCGLD
jgi:tryptophan synthase alpha subunit